jgi:predicted Zn-dependent protease
MSSEDAGRPLDGFRALRMRGTQKPTTRRLADHLHAVKEELEKNKPKEAHRLLREAMAQFPDDPVLLSYTGYLQALVERKIPTGIETCRKALALLKKKREFVDADFSAVYLNLGRACTLGGKRKEALDALNRGLAYESAHQEIRKELRRMGMRRKKPPIPFLSRSNPLNKYLGLLLHRKQRT